MRAYEFNPNLGTNPFERDNKISIYPNPAESSVHIHALDSAVREIKVHYVLGKEIMSEQNDEVNVSALPKGIYILKVTLDNNSSYSSKLVKK